MRGLKRGGDGNRGDDGAGRFGAAASWLHRGGYGGIRQWRLRNVVFVRRPDAIGIAKREQIIGGFGGGARRADNRATVLAESVNPGG